MRARCWLVFDSSTAKAEAFVLGLPQVGTQQKSKKEALPNGISQVGKGKF